MGLYQYSAVKCHYNTIQFIVLYMVLQWLGLNFIQVELSKDTPYLALMGQLWGPFCEDLRENWLRYNGTTLYIP